MGNYHSLFEAYMTAPNMGAYIMDHFIDRERVKALMVITKASVLVVSLVSSISDGEVHRYKALPLSFIHNVLAFDSLDAARIFLVNHSAAFFTNLRAPDSEKILDCRPAFPQLSQAFEERYRKVHIKGAI
jgi:SAC3 family protein LENG8/THP3